MSLRGVKRTGFCARLARSITKRMPVLKAAGQVRRAAIELLLASRKILAAVTWFLAALREGSPGRRTGSVTTLYVTRNVRPPKSVCDSSERAQQFIAYQESRYAGVLPMQI